MEQLTPLDSAFLYLESDRMPMHVSGLTIYDATTAPDGFSWEKLKAALKDRTSQIPRFLEKLLEVPLKLDYPYWVRDTRFNPDNHLFNSRLPAPGNWKQLRTLTERLMARPLDRAHPLWEIHCIEGLNSVEGVPKGSFALLIKAHHAAVDGASAVEVTNIIHDPQDGAPPPTASQTSADEPVPAAEELLRRAFRRGAKFPGVVANAVSSLLEARDRLADLDTRTKSSHPQPKPFTAPRTRFNAQVSGERSFDAARFSLEQVRTVAFKHQATVNDVILGVCAGGLRKYLERLKELPPEALVAMTPVSIREENDKGTMGNKVSSMLVSLQTQIAGPADRFQAICENTRSAKANLGAIGARKLFNFTELLAPVLTPGFMQFYEAAGLSRYHPPLYNLVITNVKGPKKPLSAAGAKMAVPFASAPVFDGLGMLIAVVSCGDVLTVSVTACRKILPDPERLVADLYESFEEIKAIPGTGRSQNAAATALA